ncbi:MAG: glycosyltransferase family 9 protein [Opitutaceae bacterium]
MTDVSPHVLVIRRRYLGDVVLLGSVLRNLRLHWPDAQITVLTEAGYTGILALNPDVNASLAFPKSLIPWLSFIRTLRRARFTHVLDFDNTEKTALVTRLTGALVRATFNRELIPFRYGSFYTHVAKVTNDFYDSHHITETYLALLPAIGVPVVSREVRLVPRPADLASSAKLLGRPVSSLRSATSDQRSPNSAPISDLRPSNSAPLTSRPAPFASPKKVLLHPGSRSPYRIWPPERFAAVCDRLQDELNAQVFVVAGPGEQALVKQIREHAKSHLIALEQQLTVGQFAGLLAQFDLFLCHDSGPMHIAAAVGTPVVALFGSQNATIWRPLGPRQTVLQTTLPCVCLGTAATPTPCEPGNSYRSYCVRKLTEDEVFAAIAAQLAPR